jgi:hypothetical protein
MWESPRPTGICCNSCFCPMDPKKHLSALDQDVVFAALNRDTDIVNPA